MTEEEKLDLASATIIHSAQIAALLELLNVDRIEFSKAVERHIEKRLLHIEDGGNPELAAKVQADLNECP